MLVPLARPFVRDWCGREGSEVRRALGWLDRHGWIWRAARHEIGKPKPMTLWGIAENEPSRDVVHSPAHDDHVTTD
jgi:hypothetical protein